MEVHHPGPVQYLNRRLAEQGRVRRSSAKKQNRPVYNRLLGTRGAKESAKFTNRLIHREKAILPKRNRQLKPKASPASAPALPSDPGPDNQQGSEGLRHSELASA